MKDSKRRRRCVRREAALDLSGRLDEVDAVVVVFLDAGRDREDVRVEDDVFRREAAVGE